MADVSSTSMPGTREIPFYGGGLLFTGVTVSDSSLNDDFVTSFDAAIWSQRSGAVGVTLVPGGAGHPLRFDVALGGSNLYLDRIASVAAPSTVQFGYTFSYSGTLPDENKVFIVEAKRNGSTEYVTVSVVRDDTNSVYEIRAEYQDSTMGAPTTLTKAYNDVTGSLRMVFANARCSIWDSKGPDVLVEFDFSIDDGGGEIDNWLVDYSIGVESSAGGGTWSMIPSPFKLLPTLKGVWDKRGSYTAWINSANKYSVSAALTPAYPGEFTPVLCGSGAAQGTSEATTAVSVKYTDPPPSATKLMASNLTKLYTDATGVLTCRNFAIRHPDNRKDIIMPMMCFDDGSVQNADKTDIILTRSGRLQERTAGLGYIAQSGGKRYGESFRFDRILTDSDVSLFVPSGPPAEPVFGTTLTVLGATTVYSGRDTYVVYGHPSEEGAVCGAAPHGSVGQLKVLSDRSTVWEYDTSTSFNIQARNSIVVGETKVWIVGDRATASVRGALVDWSTGVADWNTSMGDGLLNTGLAAMSPDESNLWEANAGGTFLQKVSAANGAIVATLASAGSGGGRCICASNTHVVYLGADGVLNAYAAAGFSSGSTPDWSVDLTSDPTNTVTSPIDLGGRIHVDSLGGFWALVVGSAQGEVYLYHVTSDGTLDIEIDVLAESSLSVDADHTSVCVDKYDHVYALIGRTIEGVVELLRWDSAGNLQYRSQDQGIGSALGDGSQIVSLAVDGMGYLYIGNWDGDIITVSQT